MPEPDSEPLGPQRLIAHRYRIEHEIAAGGMGVVYRATQLGLDRSVAFKVMHRGLASSPEALERFGTEARVTAHLKGAHVVDVLDMGQLEDGTPFIVYEYLDGRDLRELITERTRIPMAEAVDYIVQVCEALAEAHAAGIVHRDIKPENLLVTRAPEGAELIKLLDFGVSKCAGEVHRSMTDPGNALGSPQYMAPEQMLDPSSVDARSDIWAVGAVLHEMLTGRSPFERGTIPAICAAVHNSHPPSVSDLRPEVPTEVDAVVARCMKKDPAARFSDVGQIALALAPFGLPWTWATAQRTQRILGRASRACAPRRALEIVSVDEEETFTLTTDERPPQSHRRGWLIGGAGLLALGSVAGSAWVPTNTAWSWVGDRIDPRLDMRASAPAPVEREFQWFPEARFVAAAAVPERDTPDADPLAPVQSGVARIDTLPSIP